MDQPKLKNVYSYNKNSKFILVVQCSHCLAIFAGLYANIKCIEIYIFN